MSIYTPNDAITFAKAFVKNMTVDDATVKYKILDFAAKMIHMAAPWRWTLSQLPSVELLAANSTTSLGTLPADFFYLETAFMTDGNKIVHLEVVPSLPAELTGAMQGVPAQCAVIGAAGASGSVIVNPIPPAGSAWRFFGAYKKTHTQITAANAASAGAGLPPDEWFWVFCEAVLYYAYRYGDYTERMGSAQTASNGQVSYNGQLGVVMATIQDMRLAEKLPVQTWTKMTPQLRG